MRVVNTPLDHTETQEKGGFKLIPRFCYRKSFSPIAGTKLTRDRGWGCCFRSAQGLLAEFAMKLLEKFPERYTEAFGCAHPLALFYDSESAPFGIHKLVLATAKYGIEPGNWAKPSLLAAGIRDVMEGLGLGCIVTQDFGITKTPDLSTKFPAILLIPGLFGLHKFDMSFFPFLALCICIDGGLGFVSGCKNSAYYIFGVDCGNQSFLYFDPHTTKEAAVTETDFPSFFSLPKKTLKAASANPSMLLGFMVPSETALDDLLLNLGGCCESPIRVRDEGFEEAMAARVLDIDDIDLESPESKDLGDSLHVDT